jgi:hypothetical protein
VLLEQQGSEQENEQRRRALEEDCIGGCGEFCCGDEQQQGGGVADRDRHRAPAPTAAGFGKKQEDGQAATEQRKAEICHAVKPVPLMAAPPVEKRKAAAITSRRAVAADPVRVLTNIPSCRIRGER